MQLQTTPVRGESGVPDEVLSVLHTAETALVESPRPSPVHGTAAQWAEVVAVAQHVINRAVAVQDEAMVALAAIEPHVLEDGTVVESHRAPGHVSLDAPALVSGALSVSSRHAENRVRAAVRLVADGPSGADTATGLGALHEAMAEGRLDSYRAGVLADELEQAPPEVASAVVQALETSFDSETGPQLRARCRRVLTTISPDLLHQRASRARESCGLRRFAQEPGVDQWEGTFPSEDAARAWAAIDARAQQLRADGTCPRIDRARAQALIDLVTGSATITTTLTLTVPAATATAEQSPPTGTRYDAVPAPAANDTTGHPASAIAQTGTSGHPALATPKAQVSRTPHAAADRLQSSAPAASMPSADDLIEVTLSGNPQPVLVTRAFLDVVARALEGRTLTRECHPDSGALLGSAGSSAHRPPASLVALVKQRDGRCRFPGCHVNARFCDLDHVRPWPAGPTDARNLICLCRRHHRIKQRRGWQVRLAPDGQCTWVDPAGRVRTTSAIDALHTVVLRAHGGPSDSSTSRSRTTYDLLGTVSDRYSALEFTLEHHAAAITTADLTRRADLSSASLLATGDRSLLTMEVHQPHGHRPRADRFVVAHAWPSAPGHRTSRHCSRSDRGRDDDDPPF